nr:protein SSXT-like [Aedes albopictus]
MSVAYSQQQQSQQPPNPGNRGGPGGPMNRGQGPPPSPMHIQKILDENAGLIQTIQDFQNMGKAHECMSYHVALHRNLVYLANLADPQHNIQALLPVSFDMAGKAADHFFSLENNCSL